MHLPQLRQRVEEVLELASGSGSLMNEPASVALEAAQRASRRGLDASPSRAGELAGQRRDAWMIAALPRSAGSPR